MKNIVLIGIMGCGKTTISKLLAEKLQRPVIDIDEYIVEKFGTWPVPRDFWANLIKGLEVVNPKFIAFDLLFTKHRNALEKGDKELIEAVRNNKNVYLSMNFDNYPKEIRIPPVLNDNLKVELKNDNIIPLFIT